MKNKYIKLCFIVHLTIFSLMWVGCEKQWLEAKPNKAIISPSTVMDFQSILDNSAIMNQSYPNLSEVASDDFTVSYADWQAGIKPERNAYIWNTKDLYEGRFGELEVAYKRILTANVVIRGIERVDRQMDSSGWDQVLGSALFFRGMEFFNLSQQYVVPYLPENKDKPSQLLLPLAPELTKLAAIVTVGELYTQIVTDLKSAIALLPEKQLYLTRPSKAAVHALLARVFLVMGDYNQALLHSQAALDLEQRLLDYNTLNMSTAYKIPQLNVEVLFQASITTYTLLELARKTVNIELYNLYDDNDLRKKVYFYDLSGKKVFTGSYLNSEYNVFGGLATDEMYLIKSECLARANKTEEAMAVINALLRQRWKTGTFVSFVANDPEQALSFILLERRKELVFRNLRWSDLRRLNADPRFSAVLSRTLNGITYKLEPNSNGYTFPIPVNQ